MPAAGILLHGFGQRYDLPAPLALYLFAAGGVVVVSFVMVVMFAGGQVGAKAVAYPRRAIPLLTRIAQTRWPRVVGGLIGVLGLAAVIITGLFGSTDNDRNPAEYLTWIYFWAATVILSGLVGNLWYLLNPWAAIYDGVAQFTSPPRGEVGPLAQRAGRVGRFTTQELGIWPAVVAFSLFACFELTTGVANQPWLVGSLALLYSAVTLAGMYFFGRDEWLDHCEAFTVLFGIIGKFGPVEAERDERGRIAKVYLRPWGVGLLQPGPAGWGRVGFVILMLSTLAFDGIESTPARGHRCPCGPAARCWIERLDPIIIGVGVHRPPADGVDDPTRGSGGQVVAPRERWCSSVPAVRRQVVDRARVGECEPRWAKAAHHDQVTTDGSGGRRAARRRQTPARLPDILVLAVQPEIGRRGEVAEQPADRVQRVAGHGQRHVVPRPRQVGDALPAVCVRVVAVDARDRVVRRVDPARHIDPVMQHRGVQLLQPLREGRGGGPLAPGGGEGGD